MSKKKLRQKRRGVLVFTALIVIAVIAGLLWSSQPVHYKDLKTVKSSDGKFQIDVPKQMQLYQSGINTLDYQDLKSGKSKDLVSHLRIESQFVGQRYIAKTKGTIVGQLKNKQGSYFESFRQKAANSPSAKNLYFGDFADYKGKPEGVISNFSYSYPPVEVSGAMLITFSKDSIYIITVEATKSVWENNPHIWDTVLSSFREN